MGDKHVGFGKQTAFGTPAAATIWLELQSEGVQLEPQYQPISTIRSVSPRVLSLGSELSRGPFRAIGNYQDLASLVWFFFGDSTTTGTYTHTVPHPTTPVFVRPPFTFEAQRDLGDGGDTFKYQDCILTEMELSVAVDDLFSVSGALLGGVQTLGSPSTPSYPALDLIQPTECSVLIDTVALDAERFSVQLAWPVDEPRKLGSTGLARKPRDAGELTVKGSFVLLQHNATQFAKFTGHTNVDLQLLAAIPGAPNEELQINLNSCKITRATPLMDGRQTPKPTYEFEAQLDPTIFSPVSFVVTNDKAGPLP